MVSVSARVFSIGAAAVLIMSGVPMLGVQAEPAAQAPAAPAASTLDPLVLKTLQWRSVGPARAGRSIAVSGVKGRPKEAYAGQTGGGLWKTVDGGESWLPVTDGKIHSSSVGAVAVSETNPDIVFIGMGESCIRGNIQPGDGVYKSTDAGKTWTHVGFSESQAISKIRIHPTNPDIVFVASFGKYGVPSEERGIFKSTDGGKTWQRKLFRDAKTGGVDIAIDAHNPNVMFAALWEAFRVEYSMSSGGPGSGLFKSTDGGETWTEISRRPGLPTTVLGKIGVAVSGAEANRIFAIVEAEHGGLFRSDDAGATWTLINDGRNIRQRAFYYTHIAADPHDKDLVYALNVGTFRSTDGGKTMVNFAAGDSHDLWIDPDDSNQSCTATTAAARCRSMPARHSARGPRATIRPASSITSPRPVTCRTTCAARSRTAARSVCPATPASAPGAAEVVAAAAPHRRPTAPAVPSRATLRPIRKTSTSSSPAVTTARS